MKQLAQRQILKIKQRFSICKGDIDNGHDLNITNMLYYIQTNEHRKNIDEIVCIFEKSYMFTSEMRFYFSI